MGPIAPSGSGTATLRGLVHGGQQPVSNSAIQLYTVGSGGNHSSATSMLTKSVTTDGQGNFDLTGLYQCGLDSQGNTIPAGSGQVYIVATGGNPGLKAGTINGALVLVSALGTCSSLSAGKYVEINEVTTVAAAWALNPFMTSALNVGATNTNASGIENAFLDAALLADTTNGTAAVLPTNLSIETDKLYGLADAIASCVNSDGTTGCFKLFAAATPTSGTAPTTTLQAALNIVRNPGENVVAVYNSIGDFPPFASGLTQAPNDWTMSLTITGGGLNSPTALAIDQASNVWVAEQPGVLSLFGPQGQVLNSTGFTATGLAQCDSVAIDSNGYVWVTNFNGTNGSGSVTEFNGSNSGGNVGSVAGTYSNGISYPTAVTPGASGEVIVANNGNGSGTVYNSSGTLVASELGAGDNLGMPLGIAADTAGGFWLPDAAYSVAHISSSGAVLPNDPACCYNPHGVATDASGNVWVSNYLDGSYSEISSTGSTQLKRQTGGGLNSPQAVAIDSAQNVWFANFDGQAISEIAGSANLSTVGDPISPSDGVYGTGGYGLDISLIEPAGIAPDRSGNIWIVNGGQNSVVMFFGLSSPTATPLQSVPTPP